jgi:deoxyribose-phosphate aldolase
MNARQFGHLLDHTLLSPESTEADIIAVSKEALFWNCATLAVEPKYVATASHVLKGSDTGITVGIAYPDGCLPTSLKARQIEKAIEHGASDVDYVIDIGALREGDDKSVVEELKTLRKASEGFILKCILEVSLLSDEEIKRACDICVDGGADFVKSSTGYYHRATMEQIALMCSCVKGSGTHVKAAGGFSSLSKIKQAIELGVTRIGTSSAMSVMRQFLSEEGL